MNRKRKRRGNQATKPNPLGPDGKKIKLRDLSPADRSKLWQEQHASKKPRLLSKSEERKIQALIKQFHKRQRLEKATPRERVEGTASRSPAGEAGE